MFCAGSSQNWENKTLNEDYLEWCPWPLSLSHVWLPILKPFMLGRLSQTPSLEARCSQTPTLAPVPIRHVCVFWCLSLYAHTYSVCVCVCGQQRSAIFSQPSWDWQMESFHTQTERQDTGNRGVFNSPGAAVVGINLGQWRSAHGELASGASLAFS